MVPAFQKCKIHTNAIWDLKKEGEVEEEPKIAFKVTHSRPLGSQL